MAGLVVDGGINLARCKWKLSSEVELGYTGGLEDILLPLPGGLQQCRGDARRILKAGDVLFLLRPDGPHFILQQWHSQCVCC